MPAQQKPPKSIDEYIAGVPAEIQLRLQRIRDLVSEIAPDADETISYRIPAFKLYGRILIYFAAHTEHIGMYPAPYGVPQFERDLAKYGAGKGTLRFPHDKPLPIPVIKRVLKYRLQQTLAKAVAKRKAK